MADYAYANPPYSNALSHRLWRQGANVRDHIDHHRAVCGDRFCERRGKLARLLHPDAHCAHVLGDLGEVHVRVGPQLARLLGLRAAIGAVEAALALIAAAVVVYDRHTVQLPAHRGLDLADVVPEAGIAGEHHDGPLRTRRLGADAGAERKAEMAGGTEVALAGGAQIIHTAHPYAGVAGVDDDDRVVRHVFCKVAAHPRRMDRHLVRIQERVVLRVPLPANALRLIDPRLAPR